MIVGITMVRNEAHIIASTLDHYEQYCDGGIVVVNDASEDDTLAIVQAHRSVISVIDNAVWESDAAKRMREDGELRRRAFGVAREAGADWVLCFDADERLVDFDHGDLNGVDAVRCRLWDYYITPEDVAWPWQERRWLGPEFRDIMMIFRPGAVVSFPDREPILHGGSRIAYAGHVRHYGKAISVEKWERICDYYANHYPEPTASKWVARRGKAIHTKSDFGRPLIRWEDREKFGVRIDHHG